MTKAYTKAAAALATVIPLIFSGATAFADDIDKIALQNAFEASRKAEGSKVDDIPLIDQDGRSFRLYDLLKDGKPLVISYVYTSCPVICPSITSEFRKAVTGARGKLGKRFNALTISFDPGRDTPEALRRYGLRFTGDFIGFAFATSGKEDVGRLLGQTGFFYRAKDDGSYDHIDMATILRPDGTVFRQVYGIRSQAADIENRLMELFTGKAPGIGAQTLVDKLKFFCYRYDPYSGRYVFDYAIIVGVLVQAVVMGAIVIAVWGGRLKGLLRRPR